MRAIAAWLAELAGATRVELWELVTPQQHFATYALDAQANLDAFARDIAERASVPSSRKSVGFALFAYVTNDLNEEAARVALVREGVLVAPDPCAPNVEQQVMVTFLRGCERFARHRRLVERIEQEIGPIPPRRQRKRAQ
jgi:hypothetical protein